MAGVSADEISDYLCRKLNTDQFRGVVYYDTALSTWRIQDMTTRQTTDLTKSPIHERETFVFFDGAHSRGADMKLLLDAVAMQTLGPHMGKDKLMQGAGGMRQLGGNQAVIFALPAEVSRSVAIVCGLDDVLSVTVKHLLLWVFNKSAVTNEQLLPYWVSGGSHDAKCCSKTRYQ